MYYITDKLLVGNLEDLRKPPAFVEAVLCVASEISEQSPPACVYGKVPFIEYSEVAGIRLKQALEWLESRKGQCLMVCCRVGMGRSVSVVVAYLCCVEHMTYSEAVQLAKLRRPGATPLPNLETTIEQVKALRVRGSGPKQ
jgi:protein-tyrosine phosphatase